MVLQTNGKEVERPLLLEESFRRTLRLYLEGAYSHEEMATTDTIKKAAEQCPLVFVKLFHLPLVAKILGRVLSIRKAPPQNALPVPGEVSQTVAASPAGCAALAASALIVWIE
jgi:hypothetical protein